MTQNRENENQMSLLEEQSSYFSVFHSDLVVGWDRRIDFETIREVERFEWTRGTGEIEGVGGTKEED